MIRALAGRAAAVLVLTVTAGVLLSAPDAGAASWGCSQVQGGLCGSQQLIYWPLMLAAHNNATARHGNREAEVKAASAGSSAANPGNPTEDWTGLRVPSPPVTGAGALEYDPAGRPSGWCLTAEGTSAELNRCDPDSWSQQWTADESSGVGYAMCARSTRLCLTARHRQYSAVTLTPLRNTHGQLWGFNGTPRLSAAAAARAALTLAA